ncbi:MAG: UBA/THIF-type binding protein [Deltaproteobacteria bacterium]|nr:UBA/THIF-type binding protein [Deltaproteobacteria bacterium]
MNLQDHILKSAKPVLAPSKKTVSTISLQDRESLVSAFGVSRRAVEIAALDLEVWPQRYLRNMGSLGVSGQKKLLQSRALLIGAGGLGGTVAILLARMGLGSLVIADGDSFSEDNLNRQALSLEPNVGVLKVRAARMEIARVNAATEVEVFEGFVAEKELSDLIRGVQVAIDALDNMPSRFRLEKASKDRGVPLVHGAVAGFTGQVTTIYPEDVGFRAFYGDPQNTPEKGIEVELGNLAGIVSTIASLQVQEAVKVLTGLGRPLRNRLLFIDSLNGVSETISLK